MKTITIHVFDKITSRSMSETINIYGKTKEQIKNESDRFFSEIPFYKWYYEVECYDDLTDEEQLILDELDLNN